MRDSKRLLDLRLPFRESFYYPVWQFTGTGGPIEAMPRLIEAAEIAGMDLADLDAFMVSAGGGTPPYKVLEEGNEEWVLSWIRAALDGGAREAAYLEGLPLPPDRRR